MQSFFREEEKLLRDLAQRIARLCDGLVYVSERDADVTLFVGERAAAVNADAIRATTSATADARIETIDFQIFFSRLTKSETWHADAQREQTKKFLELKTLLEDNLDDLKVFKIGVTRVTIYAVGLDREGRMIGIKTEAVET